MVETEVPANAAQVQPIHVHAERLLADFWGVALALGFRGVLAVAEHTTIALGTGGGLPGFILPFGLVTMWTSYHGYILAQDSIHSRKL